MKELLEAGVHFGHQTKRWNPKMKEFIFGERNGIYIIDLQKTLKLFKEASKFVSELSAAGKTVLFVGTSERPRERFPEERLAAGGFITTQRGWAGLLPNGLMYQRPVKRLKDSEELPRDGGNELL